MWEENLVWGVEPSLGEANLVWERKTFPWGGEPCLWERNLVWGVEPSLGEENLVWGSRTFSGEENFV
jgi:hypothetical protein